MFWESQEKIVIKTDTFFLDLLTEFFVSEKQSVNDMKKMQEEKEVLTNPRA